MDGRDDQGYLRCKLGSTREGYASCALPLNSTRVWCFRDTREQASNSSIDDEFGICLCNSNVGVNADGGDRWSPPADCSAYNLNAYLKLPIFSLLLALSVVGIYIGVSVLMLVIRNSSSCCRNLTMMAAILCNIACLGFMATLSISLLIHQFTWSQGVFFREPVIMLMAASFAMSILTPAVSWAVIAANAKAFRKSTPRQAKMMARIFTCSIALAVLGGMAVFVPMGNWALPSILVAAAVLVTIMVYILGLLRLVKVLTTKSKMSILQAVTTKGIRSRSLTTVILAARRTVACLISYLIGAVIVVVWPTTFADPAGVVLFQIGGFILYGSAGCAVISVLLYVRSGVVLSLGIQNAGWSFIGKRTSFTRSQSSAPPPQTGDNKLRSGHSQPGSAQRESHATDNHDRAAGTGGDESSQRRDPETTSETKREEDGTGDESDDGTDIIGLAAVPAHSGGRATASEANRRRSVGLWLDSSIIEKRPSIIQVKLATEERRFLKQASKKGKAMMDILLSGAKSRRRSITVKPAPTASGRRQTTAAVPSQEKLRPKLVRGNTLN